MNGNGAAIVAIAAEGPDLDPARHGAKAYGLQQLLRFGLAVPPAIVVPISAAAEIGEQVSAGAGAGDLAELAAAVGSLGLSDDDRLAVRSGGPVSLPGGLDTVLDVHPGEVAAAIATVVASTHGLRAESVARATGLDAVPPTAVVIQRQVDATVHPDDAAGVATSCDPVSGESGLHGSFAWQTRGDAVMSGTVAVEPIEWLGRRPDVLAELAADAARLHEELSTPVEVEFVIESGRLWYVQLRPFSLPPAAEDPVPPGRLLGRGRPASPGVGEGQLHVDVDDALDAIADGRAVVIALETSSPSDVAVMVGAAGVVTVLGGPESHAAVVTRGAGVPAVVSVQGLRIVEGGLQIGGVALTTGSPLIVDGSRGHLRSGA